MNYTKNDKLVQQPRKLIVFGAGSGIGKEVALQGAAAGYKVVGVVRHEMPAIAGIEYVQGSVTDSAFVAHITKNCDAVVSAVGTSQYKQPVSLYSESAKALIQGMSQSGTSRLIVLSAGGATIEKNDPLIFRFVFKPILQRFLRHLYADMLRMERLLETSDLDWTILRLSYLVDKLLTGKYRTAREAAVRYGWSIGRADAAHYILHNLDAVDDYRHHVCIAN